MNEWTKINEGAKKERERAGQWRINEIQNRKGPRIHIKVFEFGICLVRGNFRTVLYGQPVTRINIARYFVSRSDCETVFFAVMHLTYNSDWNGAILFVVCEYLFCRCSSFCDEKRHSPLLKFTYYYITSV